MSVRGDMLSLDPLSVWKAEVAKSEVSKACVYC